MEAPKMNCPVFQKQERITKELTDKINNEKKPDGKIRYAEELLKEINLLLSCPKYAEQNLECKGCRTIANLRKETAELITKTKELIK